MSKQWAKLIQRLCSETRNAYREAGTEMSEEAIGTMVKECLDEVWPAYLQKEVAELGGLNVLQEADKGDDD